MLRVLIFLGFCVSGFNGAASAQTATESSANAPVDAAEFEAYATGHTLTYTSNGMDFGTEQYLPGRQVLWVGTDGICQRGSWYPKGGDICFEYSDDPGTHCWAFSRTAGSLTAIYTSESGGPTLSEAARSTTPLDCKGPFLGV